MKYTLTALLFLLIQSTSTAQASADKLLARTMTKEAMLEDFNFLRKILEETHPALYRYTPKEAMQKKMDSIAGSFTRDMPFYDYYLTLASFISDIRCAHTHIIPKGDLGGYLNEIKILPLEIIPIEDHMYISVIGANDNTILPGFELLAINNQPVSEVKQQIYSHLWGDGYIQTSKKALTYGNLFGLYYYLMVERPDSFLLKLRNLEGAIVEKKIPAIKRNEYVPIMFKNPVNKRVISLYKEKNKKDQKNGWRLEMLKEPGTALLRITGFGGGKNEEEAVAKMRTFMEGNITRLKNKNIKNLIIDLRNNGGGWDIQGVELFTYLMQDTTPVHYFKRQYTITDSSEFFKYSDLSAEDKASAREKLIPQGDGTFNLKEEYTSELKLQYPKTNRFTGKIYFLVNGGSGSTTSEFTAVAHSNNIGVFIGEETGGAYEGDNGGHFLHFELPNSRISVGTVLISYMNAVKTPAQMGRGVIPDYNVLLTKEDLLNARDTQLEFTLDLIRKKK
ncbi:MAG: S41 family peptidase [Chitinophagaceae bacterium]